MHDSKVKEKFIYFRSRGMSYGEIARKIKVSKTTLVNWGKELNEEISTLSSEYKNELREKYQVSDIQRLEFLGERFKSIQEEIAKRGLGDLKISQLLGLEAKYLKYFEES